MALRPAPAGAYLVSRHRSDVRVPLLAGRGGEAIVDLRAAAPGTGWAIKGSGSSVVSIDVDGHYATDLVVSGSAPLTRRLALGHAGRGVHVLRLRFAADRSPVRDATIRIDRLRMTTYDKRDPEYQILRFAPIMYGRNLPDLGSPCQSATTDAPLIAWHETTPAATPGHVVLTYSLIWSNEDGGTNTPALMARWAGRPPSNGPVRSRSDYLPGPSLLNGTGDVELTASAPSAVVWSR